MVVKNVPRSLADAKALDGHDGYAVKITKGEAEHGGGPGCGHSAVCIVLLPILIADAVFPEHYRVATISHGGKREVEAIYSDDGRFARATVFENGFARHVMPVEARCLARTLAVEVSRAPVDAKGKEGPTRRTSIEAQVPLVEGYAKLVDELTKSDSKKAASCVVEATHVLDHEALPLLERAVTKTDAPDLRSTVIAAVCENHPLADMEDTHRVGAAAVGADKSPALAVAVFGCFAERGVLDPKSAAPALEALEKGLGGLDDQGLADVLSNLTTYCYRMGFDGEGCTKDAADAMGPMLSRLSPPLRAAVATMLDLSSPKDDLLSFLRDPAHPKAAAVVVGALRPEDAQHREMAHTLLKEPEAHTYVEPLMLVLRKGDAAFDKSEMPILLALSARTDVSPRARALVLEALRKLGPAESDLAPLEKALADAGDKAPRGEIAAVLAGLGDQKAGSIVMSDLVPVACAPKRVDPAPSSSASPSAVPSGVASALPSAAAPATSAAPRPHYDCSNVSWSPSEPTAVERADELELFALAVGGCPPDDLAKLADSMAEGGLPPHRLSCVHRPGPSADPPAR